MSEITDEFVNNLAFDIININCLHCRQFSEPVSTSCCWCDSIGEIVTRELFFAGSGSEERRQEDEDRVAAAWEKIQKDWFNGSG